MAATRAIELFLARPEQLFNSLDPSPFNERDLDSDAEHYIIGWAQEFDRSAPLKLVVHLPDAAHKSRLTKHIPEAVSHYFADRAEQTRLERRELLRIGWRSLAIGMIVLAICFSVSQYVVIAMSQHVLGSLLAESLLILGWVANWRPLEIFLYDWWPIERRRRLLKRLAGMPVEIHLSQQAER
jgi:hypothetical protein